MYYIKSAESVGIKDRRATRPVLGLGQRVTQRGRSRVVEVVVKVGVRDGVASLGPVEEGVPAVGEQSVGAATVYVSFEEDMSKETRRTSASRRSRSRSGWRR